MIMYSVEAYNKKKIIGILILQLFYYAYCTKYIFWKMTQMYICKYNTIKKN